MKSTYLAAMVLMCVVGELEWAPTPDVADAVSIFTAVQEQRGLKLESDQAALDVVVVERIERPSGN